MVKIQPRRRNKTTHTQNAVEIKTHADFYTEGGLDSGLGSRHTRLLPLAKMRVPCSPPISVRTFCFVTGPRSGNATSATKISGPTERWQSQEGQGWVWQCMHYESAVPDCFTAAQDLCFGSLGYRIPFPCDTVPEAMRTADPPDNAIGVEVIALTSQRQVSGPGAAQYLRRLWLWVLASIDMGDTRNRDRLLLLHVAGQQRL